MLLQLTSAVLILGMPVVSLASDIQQLDGSVLQNAKVIAISATEVRFQLDGKEQTAPLSQVIAIELNQFPRNIEKANYLRLRLVDGTQLSCHAIKLEAASIKANLFNGQTISMPFASLSQLICEAQDVGQVQLVEEMASKKLKQDVLRVLSRDGKSVNTFEGFVDKPDAKGGKLNFKPENSEAVTVDLNRVRAILLAREPAILGSAVIAKVHDTYGNTYVVNQLLWKDNKVSLQGAGGYSLEISCDTLQKIDLTMGKLIYLGDIEPLKVIEEPLTSPLFHYRRNMNLEGKPLSLNRKTYRHGLAMHSRTVLEYDVSGYSTFRALLGVDDLMTGSAHAEVRIEADGQQLFKGIVTNRNGNKPMDLNLKLGGAKMLRLVVDYGDDLDMGDHILFAEARVLK